MWAKWQLAFYAAIAGLLLSSLILGAGYLWGKSASSLQVAEAVIKEKERVQKIQDKLTTDKIANDTLLRTEIDSLKRRLKRATTDNPACYYTPERIRLLNEARGALRETPSVDAGANPRPTRPDP